jgi:hypothetical protein
MRIPVIALLLALPAAAQTPTQLVQQAIDAAQSAKTSQTRFTYFDLEHNQNRNEKGKLFSDRIILYEDTYIADLPYKRVIEVDHKPLTGDELAREQARYDEAVAQRKGFDTAARARLLHEKLVDGKLHLTDLLTPAYTLTQLRVENLPQPSGPALLTHVIDAAPANSTPTKHFELWITDQNPTILRMTFDVLTDEPNMLHGSNNRTDYQLIDGIPLPTHQATHFYYPNNGKIIIVDVEHTYTRYRRFNTSARIIEEATQPPPQP